MIASYNKERALIILKTVLGDVQARGSIKSRTSLVYYFDLDVDWFVPRQYCDYTQDLNIFKKADDTEWVLLEEYSFLLTSLKDITDEALNNYDLEEKSQKKITRSFPIYLDQIFAWKVLIGSADVFASYLQEQTPT